eukprot:TRINITY_DN1307_c0_g1_i4.p1 TRINITY_DN1307_c0_g1~~TRINITY_DN1307_c0_g1_i4.p1  ORF type:complete len:314 (+),score=90.72 TRINITY_DN1307_c0_g1_i4:69-1010(+)
MMYLVLTFDKDGKVIEGDDSTVTFTRTGDISKILTIDELVVSMFYAVDGTFTNDLLDGVVCSFDESSITFAAGSSDTKVLKFSCVDDIFYQARYKLVINAKSSDNGFGESISSRVDIEVIDPYDVPRVVFIEGTFAIKENNYSPPHSFPVQRLGDPTMAGKTYFTMDYGGASPIVLCALYHQDILPGSDTIVYTRSGCNNEDDIFTNVKVPVKIVSQYVSSDDKFDTATYYPNELVRIELNYEDNDIAHIKFSDSLTIDMDEIDSTDLTFTRDGDTTVFVTATVELVSNVASCTLSGGSTISFDADSDTANET